MVGAEGGGIHGGDTVLQDLHPRTTLAADDGTPDAWAKGSIGDARLRFEHVADGTAALTLQRLPSEYVGGLHHFVSGLTQGLGGNDDVPQFGGGVSGSFVRVRLRDERKGEAAGSGAQPERRQQEMRKHERSFLMVCEAVVVTTVVLLGKPLRRTSNQTTINRG